MKDFLKKFRIQELLIIEFESWIVSLRPQQLTLGSLILSLKRKCDNIGDLQEEEAAELYKVFSDLKKMYSSTFKPDKINYLLLMMVDNQVHFHVIPRYENSVHFEGVIFNDSEWPKPLNLLRPVDIDDDMIEPIKEFLVKSFRT